MSNLKHLKEKIYTFTHIRTTYIQYALTGLSCSVGCSWFLNIKKQPIMITKTTFSEFKRWEPEVHVNIEEALYSLDSDKPKGPNSQEQSTITLQPFCRCRNEAEEMDFLTSSFSYNKKMFFASLWRHRKSADFAPDRAGGGGGMWEEFTASAAHVKMMSKMSSSEGEKT